MKALLLGLVLSLPVWPQAVTGVIHGTVTDRTGAVVPGAAVRATNVLTGETRASKADMAGSYLFPSLPVGTWRVEVQAAGFKKFIHEGIELNVNRNARVDAALEVGQLTEQLQVTGDVPLVDTYQVQMGALVDSRRARDLPLSGRNIYSLAIVLPGVTSVGAETIFTRNGNTLRVNGSRSRDSTFMLDGGFNNSHWRNAGNAAPNPDAVQEFRVITSNYNAEFGRSAGAVVNVVTRSGTNQLHGTAFEFLRNARLNARNFFQSSVSPLRQNQFGGVLGGPVAKNKTFFFGSFEGLRVRSDQFTNSALTPTAAERAGDFSAALARSRPNDPLTGQPFPNARIPVSRFDPVSVSILEKVVPLPNTADNRVEARRPSTSDQNQVLGKVDHILSQAHRLQGSFFYLNNATFSPFNGGTNIPEYALFQMAYNQQNVTIGETWMVSPSMLNEARVTLSRHRYQEVPVNRVSWPDFGSKVPLAADFHKRYPPVFRVSGRWSMGAENENLGQIDKSYSFNDVVSWTRGAHSIKFGSWFAYESYDAVLALAGAGIVTMAGEFTGNALGDFILGQAASFRQTSGTNRAMRKWDWESFVQDDWKITRRLTLNLGIRYELYPRWYSLLDDLQTFRLGAQSKVIPTAPPGLLFKGDAGVPDSMAKLDRNNWAPRVGIAFDPFGNGRTAIRAGYGFFYSTPFADAATYLQQQPFQVDYTVFGTPSFVDPYAKSGSPFPYNLDKQKPFFIFPALTNWMDESLATPYIQQFSFTVQHQLQKDLSVQAAYVGKVSRKLNLQTDANQPIFGPGATAGNVQARRPIMPGIYGQISHTESAANASYHSLQLSADRRFAKGFSVLGSYTFGKSIDETSDDSFNPVDVVLVDSRNRGYDKAQSDVDVRHILSMSYVWDLPAIKRFGPVGKYVLSGWQANGLLRVRSGDTVNVTAGRDVNLDGRGNDRPNLVGAVELPSDRPRDQRMRQFFNTAAFALPVTGTLGTAGRNLFHGPGSIGWDASFFKNIPVIEGHQFQFRAEFFNLPNRVNLGNPTGNFASGNFGRILSAGGARVTQFGLKYSF